MRAFSAWACPHHPSVDTKVSLTGFCHCADSTADRGYAWLKGYRLQSPRMTLTWERLHFSSQQLCEQTAYSRHLWQVLYWLLAELRQYIYIYLWCWCSLAFVWPPCPVRTRSASPSQPPLGWSSSPLASRGWICSLIPAACTMRHKLHILTPHTISFGVCLFPVTLHSGAWLQITVRSHPDGSAALPMSSDLKEEVS